MKGLYVGAACGLALGLGADWSSQGQFLNSAELLVAGAWAGATGAALGAGVDQLALNRTRGQALLVLGFVSAAALAWAAQAVYSLRHVGNLWGTWK